MNKITPVSQSEMQARREAYVVQASEVLSFLSNYQGYSRFLQSVKSQADRGYALSERQVAAVRAMISSETTTQLNNQVAVEPTVAMKKAVQSKYAPGDVITVNRVLAMKIGMMVGYGKQFHNIEVLEVLNDSWSHVEVRVVTCYRKVSWCTCCGLKLTDERSIALGIGPVCRKGRKVGSIEELEKLLGKKEFTIRIFKNAIKGVHKA